MSTGGEPKTQAERMAWIAANPYPKREHSLGAGKTLKLTPDPINEGVIVSLSVLGATMAVIAFAPEKVTDLVADLKAVLEASRKS